MARNLGLIAPYFSIESCKITFRSFVPGIASVKKIIELGSISNTHELYCQLRYNHRCSQTRWPGAMRGGCIRRPKHSLLPLCSSYRVFNIGITNSNWTYNTFFTKRGSKVNRIKTNIKAGVLNQKVDSISIGWSVWNVAYSAIKMGGNIES